MAQTYGPISQQESLRKEAFFMSSAQAFKQGQDCRQDFIAVVWSNFQIIWTKVLPLVRSIYELPTDLRLI